MFNIEDIRLFDENGKRHGEWLWYYTNGQLHHSCNYFHGVLHGLDETYYIDGRLGHRGYFNMGIRFGYWYWHEQKKYYLCLI